MASGAGYGIGGGTAVDADAGAVQSGSRVYPPRKPYRQILGIHSIDRRELSINLGKNPRIRNHACHNQCPRFYERGFSTRKEQPN
jgi:hypothetical protein